MDGATNFNVEDFVTGNPPPAKQSTKPAAATDTKAKVYREASRARQFGYDVPDNIADDFYNLTALESGHSHFNKNGQVKLSPVDPKDGQAAVGYSQIKPGTIKKWHGGKLDPYNEGDNILGGLLEFNSIDKADPVARRIGYFAGEHSDALKYYRRTGKIPAGGDFTGTSFKKYIAGTGGNQANSTAAPFDAEQFATGGKANGSNDSDSNDFDVKKFVTGDNQAETANAGQTTPSDEPFDVEQFVNSSPNNTQSDKPQLDPMTGKIVNPAVNQTVPVTQTVKTPTSLATDGQQPPIRSAAPLITRSNRELTPEEIDPRPQSSLKTPQNDLAHTGSSVLPKNGSQGRQTPNSGIVQPDINAALSDSQITPEQRAKAEAELNQFNQANNITNDNAAQTPVNPITVQQGAKSNLGSLTQVNVKGVNLQGDALKEYIARKSYEQVGRSYGFTPAEIDDLMVHSKEAGLIDEGQFQGQLKAAKKRGDFNYKNIIPANQIQYVLDNRREQEQIANEQAARQQVNQQTTQNANSLTGRVLNAADKGLQKGYEYLNPLNAINDLRSGEFNKADTPEDIAAKKQQEIYGDSSALDGRATDYLKNQQEARNMDGIEYAANIASSAAQVPADLFSSTVLTPAAIAQTAVERLAGKNTTVGDTFLGQASDAIKKSFGDNFKVHAGVQNDVTVAGVRKLGNVAGTLAIGLLPGGQVLTSAAFGGQTATSFYEDAKKYGASEDVRLVSAGLGAVLGTAQGSVFSRMFGGLSGEAKQSFIKEFAESMRGVMGKESANGLIKATTQAAEQSAPSAIGTIAKNSLEGAAATGGTSLAQNLTAKNLYDPNRKETSGVGASALEGAAIGGGITALSHGGQAVNELRSSEPVKRAVDSVSELYKQTKIRPNLENLQDRLAGIYDRADAANVSLSADKIISELQPELNKLPRKVQAKIIESIKEGDAEAQANAKTTLALPEQSKATAEQSQPANETRVNSEVEGANSEVESTNSEVENITPKDAVSEPVKNAGDASDDGVKAAQKPASEQIKTVQTERGTKAQVTPKVIDASDILTSLDKDYPSELQPRDRTRNASKAQISEIASKLAPALLDDSPKASDGRPLVVPIEINGQTKYAVVSGNGRSAGIKEAYAANTGKSNEYADFARSKDNSGNHPQPVYVGELDPKQIDVNSFAREANESATAKMSATEQANADAERLTPAMLDAFVPAEDGSIHAAANREFVKGFLENVAAKTDVNSLVLPDGSLSQEGATRVKNAIFAKAFGNGKQGAATLARMSESTDNNIKSITNALLKVAPKYAAFKAAAKDGTRNKSLDISSDIPIALEKLGALKQNGTSVADFIKQGNLFGADLSPFQTRVLQTLDKHSRSAKAISEILNNYHQGAEAVGDPHQAGLFGAIKHPDAEALFQAAIEDYEQNKQLGTPAGRQTDLFNSHQGGKDRSESGENLSSTDSTGKGEAASRTDSDTQRADAERLETSTPEQTAEQSAEQQQPAAKDAAAKDEPAKGEPQPGNHIAVKGRPAKLIKITYGKARVQFAGESKTKLVNVADIDEPDDLGTYKLASGAELPNERKLSSQLEDLKVGNLSNAHLFQAAKLTVSANGKHLNANPQAVEIIRRAITTAQNGKQAPVFFGAYLKPSSLSKVSNALLKMRSELPAGEARTAATEILKTIGADKFAEKGLPVVIESKELPINRTHIIAEELAHQADIQMRGEIPAKTILKLTAARRAARKVKADYDGISNETAAQEVIAKSFRDDAAVELGISHDEAAAIRDEYAELLRGNGIDDESIAAILENISETGKNFANYVRTNSRFTGNISGAQSNGTQALSAQIRRAREIRNDENGGQTNQADRLERGSQALERRVSNESLRDVERDAANQINPLIRIPRADREMLERTFKGNAAVMRQAAEEFLFMRPQPAPKTAVGRMAAKAISEAANIMTAPQSLMSSADLSAGGRQGAVLAFTEPKIAAIAFARQIKSLREKGFDDFVDNLTRHPFIDLAEHSGLFLSTLADSHSLAGREEAFMSKLLGRDEVFKNKALETTRKVLTTHVRASEQAYQTFLDSIRIDSFAKFAKEVHEYNVRKGVEDTDEQYRQLAKFVNFATGRGSLGRFEDAAPILNGFFFSPRLLSSRIQMMFNPMFYAKMPAPVRNIAIRKMLQFTGVVAGILGLLKLAGADVSFNPDDGDFIKARFGSYHYDFGAGFIQPIRLAAQLIEVAKKRLYDGEQPKFGDKDETDLIAKFLRTKLAPAWGSAANVYFGSNLAGEKTTLRGEVQSDVTPMVVGDMVKAFQKNGTTGAAMMLPGVVGIGASVYDKKEASPEQKAKDAKDDLIKRGRAGENIKPTVLDKVKYGELTKEEAKHIFKEARITDEQSKEQSKLSHGNLQTDLEDFQKMPPDKQKELLPVMIRRVKLKGTPVQREQMKAIMDALPK